jgi:hypothetical protein
MRLLYDELIAYDDVVSAIIESTQHPHGKYSAADLRLLGKALGDIPEAFIPRQHLLHGPVTPA